MATNNSGKVALFIEWVVTGESITVLALEGIMREATKLGEVTQRRFYGSGTNIEQLAEALAHHSIIAIETTVRKANQRGLCTDSAMIIDIMDLLHKDCFDWFCIASAGDCREYIRLVERIRRDGRVKGEFTAHLGPILPLSRHTDPHRLISRDCARALLPSLTDP